MPNLRETIAVRDFDRLDFMTTRLRIFYAADAAAVVGVITAAAAFEIFISIFQRLFAFIKFFSFRFQARWNVYYVRMSHKINVIAHEETDFCLFLFDSFSSFFLFLRGEKPNICTEFLSYFSFVLSTDSNYYALWNSEDCLEKVSFFTTPNRALSSSHFIIGVP